MFLVFPLLNDALDSTDHRENTSSDILHFLYLPLGIILISIHVTHHPNHLLISITYFFALVSFSFKLIQIAGRKMTRNYSESCKAITTGIVTFAIVFFLGGVDKNLTKLSGDEPFFLLIAHSLIQDHDIDLANNYENRDSLKFMDRVLTPQLGDRYSEKGLLSRHSIVLPTLFIPGYLLAGRLGAVITMNLFAALLAGLLFLTILEVNGSPKAAFSAALTIGLTFPTLIYSEKLYIEIPGALLVMSAFYFSLKASRKPVGYLPWMILLSLLAGWLKTRLLIICIPLFLSLIISRTIPVKKILIWAAILFALLIVLGSINLALYGFPFVQYAFSDLIGTTPVHIVKGCLALLFDSQYGLVLLNPVTILSLIGIIPFFRKTRRARGIFLSWVMGLGLYFLSLAAYAELNGGIAPRGRFLVVLMPFLAIPLSFVLQQRKTLFRQLLISSTFLSAGIIGFLLILNPAWQTDYPGHADHLVEQLSAKLNYDVIGIFPTFDRIDGSTFIQISVLALLITISILLFNTRSNAMLRLSAGTANLGVTGILFCFLCLFILRPVLSSHWMETEDGTFEHENIREFWLNTTRTDPDALFAHPFRCGVTLTHDSSITRRTSMSGNGKSIEVIARGNAVCNSAPILRATWNNQLLGEQRLRSDTFESYFFPFKSDNTLHSGLKFTIKHSMNTGREASVDLDKIRLSQTNVPETRAEASCLLPVTFRNFTLKSLVCKGLPCMQSQNCRLALDFQANQRPADPETFLLRLQRNYQILDQHFPVDESAVIMRNIDLNPEIGTGIFDVLVKSEKYPFLKRENNPNLFRKHGWAWIGEIEILPTLIPVRREDRQLLQKSTSGNVSVLPWAVHISAGSHVEIPVAGKRNVATITVLSNLTHIFVVLPFGTRVGTITVFSGNETLDIPIIIGKDTAEEMYAFPSTQKRLSHKTPQVVRRVAKRVDWPEQIAGIEYPSLTFSRTFRLPRNTLVDKIEISSQNQPGVLNIYAIGLE